MAQTPPERLPGAVEPGRRQPPPLPSASLKLEWTIDLPPGAGPPKALLGEALTLDELVLKGVTPSTSAPSCWGYSSTISGKEITFGAFYGIAGAIQARYQSDGYLLSFAYVPPQAVADGVFTITVVEGDVDAVVVADVDEALKRGLERSFAPIACSRPLRSDTLERYGDNLVTFRVGVRATPVDAAGTPVEVLVRYGGELRADGGTVRLAASNIGAIVRSVVNTDGVIQANTIERRDGKIILGVAGQGAARVSGEISAIGGRVTVGRGRSRRCV